MAKQAEQDIANILAWTTEQFSSEQAAVYTETLTLALQALTEGPDVIGAGDISSSAGQAQNIASTSSGYCTTVWI